MGDGRGHAKCEQPGCDWWTSLNPGHINGMEGWATGKARCDHALKEHLREKHRIAVDPCCRCGSTAKNMNGLTSVLFFGDAPNEFEFSEHAQRFCDACFNRVRVALDYALSGGDGDPREHAGEFWQNVACAMEFDRGLKMISMLGQMRLTIVASPRWVGWPT